MEKVEKIQIDIKYDIVRTLGKGGQGEVSFAINKKSSKQVAIKTLLKKDGESQERLNIRKENFVKEYNMTEGLRHQNIMRVYKIYTCSS